MQIEKNIPLPPRAYDKAGRNARYPFPDMGIGVRMTPKVQKLYMMTLMIFLIKIKNQL